MFTHIGGKIYTYVQMYTSVIREYKETTLLILILCRQERKWDGRVDRVENL